MAPYIILTIFVTIWLPAALASQQEALQNISLVVMAPFPGELAKGWTPGPALVPATIVAAREINNSTVILPNFHLNLITADSGCSVASNAAIGLLRHVFSTDRSCRIVGIIGPGCSAAALRISDLTARYEVSLIHITPSATTPQLEDAKRNTTYATISSALSYVQSFVEIMEHNNWKNIATLQDEARLYFKQTHSRFKAIVESKKVIFTGSLLVGEESVIPLENLRASRGQVVMVFAGSKTARQLLCYAYYEDMLYPSYQWIFHDRTKDNLLMNVSEFRVNGKTYSCTDKDMTKASHGVILNLFHLEQEDKDTLLPLFNRTYNDYYKEYEEQLEEYKMRNAMESNPANVYSNSYHDAVWAMALALHNASLDGVDLRSYSYGRNSDTVKVAEHLSRVDFNGMSGPITFQSNTRSVKTIIDIKQLWNGEDLLIGTFDRSRDTILHINSTIARFINDTHSVRQIKVHTALGTFAIFATILLIVLIALLQLANIVWYHHRSIKATSPNIRHLIFAGCYLYSMFVIFYSVQQAFEGLSFLLFSVLCNAMVWCIILGYSLIFGTMCVTIWRIYRLFKRFRNQRSGIFLSDNILVLCVILLLVIDMLICVVWNLLDPLMLRMQSLPGLTTPLESAYTYQCDCQFWNYWIGGIIAYKGSIVIPLVALSILNRRIKRKNFQRTKNITILIYTLFMVGGVGIPLYFLLRHQNIHVGFFLLVVILYSTILLCCLILFLPPVVSVIKQLRREKKAPRGQLKRSSVFFLTSDADIAE